MEQLAIRGEYAVCVRNLLSFDQTVTIDFHIQSKDAPSHPNQVALEDEALKLKTLTADVLEKVVESLAAAVSAVVPAFLWFWASIRQSTLLPLPMFFFPFLRVSPQLYPELRNVGLDAGGGRRGASGYHIDLVVFCILEAVQRFNFV